MRKYPEDDLQMACARYLDLLGWIMVPCGNERKTRTRQGEG